FLTRPEQQVLARRGHIRLGGLWFESNPRYYEGYWKRYPFFNAFQRAYIRFHRATIQNAWLNIDGFESDPP
ncbi:MAG: hypothetical protein JJU34_01185, partial [Lunatimonas sp.]|uniref:hypothetical protein n=1 Tax=Lunatimonas sp. TaxID=2060141 RepID=UPI00263B462A